MAVSSFLKVLKDMPFIYKYKHLLILLSFVLLLPACKDEVEKPVQPNTVMSYSHITPCDEYFSVMQACANSLQTVEERQKLSVALTALGQKMETYTDKGVIEQQCTKALEEMDAHKKAVGC
ncbi:MAG: hypothetical protein ACRCWR_11760 [Saezia sp.]